MDTLKLVWDMALSNVEVVMMIRIVLAGALGFLIGLDREHMHKTAGIRTFALIAAAAALFTTFSENGLSAFVGHSSFDPGRFASSVILGVGFIGGGMILIRDNKVEGITTAAAMFMSTAIGMAVGLGFYATAFFATFFAMLILALKKTKIEEVLEKEINIAKQRQVQEEGGEIN